MIRVAVAEDELHTYETIHACLMRYAAEKQLDLTVCHFQNGFEITDGYTPGYDIILMDIDMPLMNGMNAARIIRNLDPSVIIIFITNLSQYAIQGYSVHAFDYILKPVQYFPFSEFFGRAVSRLQAMNDTTFITVHMKDEIRKIAVRDIYYVEIINHTLYYHTTSGVYQATGKMKEIEAQLTPCNFIRCNNGYLVNLVYVDCIRENNVIVHNDSLPISRNRKKEVSAALMNYISKHVK